MWIIGVLFAFGIGLSLGLFGAGGSILTVPVFHHLFGLPVHAAIASAQVVVAATSAIAIVSHARARRVCWRTGLLVGSASTTAAFVGGRVRVHLDETALAIAFALVMLAVGVSTVRRRPRSDRRRAAPLHLLAVGAGVGLATGVLGAGGGFLLVPALASAGRLAMQHAAGTSLFVVVLSAPAALAGASHDVRLDLALPVIAVALAGSVAGARLGARLSVVQMQRGFGGLVIALGLAVLAGTLV